MGFSIGGKLKDMLLLAIFAVIILAVGVALLPTVTNSAYDAKVQADAANYTGHSVVALIFYLIPLGYGLAIALGVFFTTMAAIQAGK